MLAHKSCNLNVKRQHFLLVYMRNLTYDLKFILEALTPLQTGEVVEGKFGNV